MRVQLFASSFFRSPGNLGDHLLFHLHSQYKSIQNHVHPLNSHLNVYTCTTFGVVFVLVMPTVIRANAAAVTTAQNLISRDVYLFRSKVGAQW